MRVEEMLMLIKIERLASIRHQEQGSLIEIVVEMMNTIATQNHLLGK